MKNKAQIRSNCCKKFLQSDDNHVVITEINNNDENRTLLGPPFKFKLSHDHPSSPVQI